MQVGIRDVPNDFFVDAVVKLAKLSLPARSRLMRIFNDYYNVDRFILDESFFGSLLSDYSGVKIEKDGPVLSFGRKNTFELKILNPTFKFGTFRVHYEQALSNDLYRLDVAILGETEPHTKNYNGIYERNHVWYNFKALYPLPQSLLPAIKFAKAQVILSDSWDLGDINACFPVSSVEERGNKFVLGSSKLSEELWNLKYKPILERFFAVHHYQVKNFSTPKIIRFSVAEHYIHFENELDSKQKNATYELENYILVFYGGVSTWHEHRHLNRSWKERQPICLIY